MQSIRYNIIERVLNVPLIHPRYKGFKMGAYKTNFSNWIAEHAILYKPSLKRLGSTPLIRINSACFTGDIFGDRRCDCSEQLYKAMDILDKEGGLIIYHFHHEGRGMGFTSKLKSYQMMKKEHISTFSAATEISNRNDLRTYSSAILILKDLKLNKVQLITNNPEKKHVLEENGIEVVNIVNITIDRPNIRPYLLSKKKEQHHTIQFKVEST